MYVFALYRRSSACLIWAYLSCSCLGLSLSCLVRSCLTLPHLFVLFDIGLCCLTMSCSLSLFIELYCIVSPRLVLCYGVLSCLVLSCVRLPCIVLDVHLLACLVLACIVLSCLVVRCIVWSHLTLFLIGLVRCCLVLPCSVDLILSYILLSHIGVYCFVS